MLIRILYEYLAEATYKLLAVPSCSISRTNGESQGFAEFETLQLTSVEDKRLAVDEREPIPLATATDTYH